MRLLDTRTGQFQWINDPRGCIYAILSHTWSEDGEQSYQDIAKIQRSVNKRNKWRIARCKASILTDPRVSSKIREACAIAAADRYELLWIDSCCIDKTSSAELSEGINSMFEWYSYAHICYVYLEDVDAPSYDGGLYPQFRRCRWHTRGWTLQELIAPKQHIFLSRTWQPLGTKHTLARMIEKSTGVDRGILLHERGLDTVSVARRMWWASKRRTTRVEDEAYSLMGIFGVHMPTVYGEGRHAFQRLQEEILKRIPDQTIFAWGPHFPLCVGKLQRLRTLDARNLLAESPLCFEHGGHIRAVSRERLRACVGTDAYIPPSEYSITSYGIRTRLPIIPPDPARAEGRDYYLAILACQDNQENLVALPLQLLSSQNEFAVVGNVEERTVDQLPDFPFPCRIISLRPEDVQERASMTDVYIHYPRDDVSESMHDSRFIFAPLRTDRPLPTRTTLALQRQTPAFPLPRYSL